MHDEKLAMHASSPCIVATDLILCNYQATPKIWGSVAYKFIVNHAHACFSRLTEKVMKHGGRCIESAKWRPTWGRITET